MKGKKEVDIKTVSQLFEKYFKTNYKKDCNYMMNVVYYQQKGNGGSIC